MRRFLSARFVIAPAFRAILETLVLTGVLSLLTILIYAQAIIPLYIMSFLFFINPVCSLYFSLRLRKFEGRWWRVWIGETLRLLTCVSIINCVPLLILLGMQFGLNNNEFVSLPTIAVLMLGLIYFPYFFFRVSIRLLIWWGKVRESRLIWSLVHTHLVAATLFQMLLAFPFFLAIAAAIPTITISDFVPSALSGFMYHLTMFLPLFGLTMLGVIGILILLLPVSVSVSYLFARPMRRRLDALIRGAQAARDGDFGARVPITGKDEIAQLQTNFNAMITNLETTIQTLRTEQDTVQGLLQSRREMMINVSHELRTPIATTRAYLESLRRQIEIGEHVAAQSHDWEIINREIERLQTLIDDLFSFSRAEVDQLTLRLTTVDAVTLIQEVVETVSPLAWRIHRVEVINSVPNWLPALAADATRLEQALLNLLHNALRYTPPGGLIIISARVENNQAAIEVRDTGEGIAPDDLPHIWDRYYRDRINGGSGLGLALVKAFIEGMNGSVAVESTVGSGTTFTLRLPVTTSLPALTFPQPVARRG